MKTEKEQTANEIISDSNFIFISYLFYKWYFQDMRNIDVSILYENAILRAEDMALQTWKSKSNN